MAASRVKAKLEIDFSVPGSLLAVVMMLGNDDFPEGVVDCFVDGGIVVSGLGTILQMRNKIIIIERNFLEKLIKPVSYENQVVCALCCYTSK